MTINTQARDRNRALPVYLIEIVLLNGGPTLYLSDRNIAANGRYYEDYLEDVLGIGAELRRINSDGRNAEVTLTFKNDRYRSFSRMIEIGDTYPYEGAECVIKEVYLDDSGAPSEEEILFKGALEEPRGIDLKHFTCSVSGIEFHKTRQWSHEMIVNSDFPDAREDVGKVIPFVYGADVLIPAHRARWGAKTTLADSISATDVNCEASDASGFPATGYLWMDDEQLAYTKEGNTLNLTRAQGGTMSQPHQRGTVMWQHLTAYDSVIAGHELKSVGDIFAEIDGHLIRVTSGVSSVFENGRHLLRATSQIRVKPGDDQSDVLDTIGINDGIGIDDGISVSDNIAVTLGGLMKTVYPDSSVGGSAPNSSIDGNTDTFNQVSYGSTNTVGFPSVNYGAIATQYIYATLQGGITVGGGWTPNSVNPSGKGRFRFQKAGGSWDDNISFTKTSPGGSAIIVYEVEEKAVEYVGNINKTGSAYRSGSVTKSGAVTRSGSVTKTGEVIISTRVVDRFHAVVSGHKDPDGNYGSAGSLIDRPDHVLKHFLVQKVGFALADIDDASFAAAGEAYEEAIIGGYRFAFAVDRKIEPGEFVRQLAFECRSTIKYHAGKWYLEFTPDTAPASVKIITNAELAGRHSQFRFDRTPVVDLKNDLTAWFERNYSLLGSESPWNGTSKESDGPSIAKYGTYPGVYEFHCIRDQVMADHVLEHMLLERKSPLLRVRFPVFYEHFDLRVGDTIEIENPLYGGRKFSIEQMRRLDKFRAEVEAVEWWG